MSVDPPNGNRNERFFIRYTRWRGDGDQVPVRILRRLVANHIGETTWGRSQMCLGLGQAAMKRILVVDDDPLICSAIRAWLEDSGFAVFVADGGETGLRALDGSTFDLMIVDIFMPHMRGFESVRVFHQRAPTVPLIAISGYVFVEQRTPAPDFLRMALELGATRCLRKPFTPKTLLTVIDQCLSESGALEFKVVAH